MTHSSKYLLVLIKQQLAKVQIDSASTVVGNSDVFPSSSVHNLDAFFWSHMSMANSINRTCALAYYYEYNVI